MADNLRVSKKFADEINARIKTKLSNGNLNKLASKAKNQIIRRTRVGKGVRTSGTTFKFPKLSESYRQQRARYKSRLSSKTSVSTSNVHATGQLVEKSIRSRVGNNKFILFLEKTRGRTLSGGRSTIDNIELNRILSRKRRWFDLSKAEKVFITREIRKLILGI